MLYIFQLLLAYILDKITQISLLILVQNYVNFDCCS
jgi:hypothetical protein